MKRSWGFLIAKQYNYQFENFYATVIQQGYMVVRGAYWFNILKWPRDPEYYSIHRKYNYRYLIRIISLCEMAYKSKSSGMEKPICDSPLKYRYRINGKDITVNFSDLDDN